MLRTAFLLLIAFLTLSLNASAAVRTWSGAGLDDNWRTAGNWVENIAPATGDDLIFPAVAARYTATNNMPFGSSIRSITIEGGTYTMGSSSILPLPITAGITVVDGTQTLNFVVQLSAAQTFAANGPAAVAVVAGVLLGTRNLTIDGTGGVGLGLVSGSGQIIKNGSGGGLVASASGYSGAVTVNQGILVLDGAMPSSAVTVNALPTPTTFDMRRFGLSADVPGNSILDGLTVAGGVGGTGTVGTVNVINGAVSAGTLSAPNGIFNTGNLTIGPGGGYAVKIAGGSPGQNGYDQLNVTGTVTLQDAQLEVLPTEGIALRMRRPLTIINNDGSEPINGTFVGLPEGAFITSASGTFRFRISYHGGDGNDVVLVRSAIRAGS